MIMSIYTILMGTILILTLVGCIFMIGWITCLEYITIDEEKIDTRGKKVIAKIGKNVTDLLR